jgi:hypothetical protein
LRRGQREIAPPQIRSQQKMKQPVHRPPPSLARGRYTEDVAPRAGNAPAIISFEPCYLNKVPGDHQWGRAAGRACIGPVDRLNGGPAAWAGARG